MDSWISCGRTTLAQSLSRQIDPIGVVDDAVEDRVGERRDPNHVVPAVDRDLAGDDERPLIVSVFDDFQEVARLLGRQGLGPPIILCGPARSTMHKAVFSSATSKAAYSSTVVISFGMPGQYGQGEPTDRITKTTGRIGIELIHLFLFGGARTWRRGCLNVFMSLNARRNCRPRPSSAAGSKLRLRSRNGPRASVAPCAPYLPLLPDSARSALRQERCALSTSPSQRQWSRPTSIIRAREPEVMGGCQPRTRNVARLSSIVLSLFALLYRPETRSRAGRERRQTAP
ncbi:hypothetical protein SAMN05444581_11382 [Methylocapsa palsarum]|uniref:Uncharacterized protein n=1 Tax=Methylocapsa palsarum TaxID=1612308 RepID=A0A1I4B993_9HYPH|nr:hypothetical protein SAMN05444581_11382 [Methylocapsa palsarum]